MPRAIPVLREKVIDDRGNIFELVIWRVTATSRNPSDVSYRLAFVRRGEAKPRVLYDNHPSKGHHRHLAGVEGPYNFVDVDQLLADFMADVERIEGEARWPRR